MIEEFVGSLANQIKKSGYAPDYLVGITTGGLVPLGLLSKELDINRIITVSASSYEKDKQGELTILYLPEIDLKHKKLLLIDEIAETGLTLKQISAAVVSKYQPLELKTATIAVSKGRCKFYPDFFALEESGWLVFPWEKKDFPEYF